MGVILFYLLWPLVWLYAPLTRRVRVIVIRDEEILVVKNWFGSGKWQLPGGGIKFGESPEAAAIREMREELAVDIRQVRLLDAEPHIIQQNGMLFRYHFVLADISNTAQLSTQHGITAHTWLRISDMHSTETEVTTAVALTNQ